MCYNSADLGITTLLNLKKNGLMPSIALALTYMDRIS